MTLLCNEGQEKMNIRKASLQDLAVITNVEKQCFPAAEAATEEDFSKRLEVYPEYFWLLEDEGKLVSFVNGMATNEPDLADDMYQNAQLHQPDGQWQMIFGVNTLPAYRRQGYAGKLLKQVIQDAKKAGRQGVVLTCKEEMVSYYQKFGFVNEGQSESTHGAVVWYQMRLVF